MTRVLVVDDSRFMRTVIGNALTDAGYDVETAANGSQAIDAVADFGPDVVTMDVEMPEVGGIEAVERIMETNPTPVLMLSAYTEAGAEATLDALERGAVDFLHKPDPKRDAAESRNIGHLATEVVDKVDAIANADVSSMALARTAASVQAIRSGGSSDACAPVRSATGPSAGSIEAAGSTRADERISIDGAPDGTPTVVIGASTGGPKIVEYLLTRLPTALGARVLVVQHMPEGFTARFAERLDSLSEYDVREAADGDRLHAGEAVVAPGDRHLEVARTVGGTVRLCLDDGERIHGVKPAIDVAMRSVAKWVDGPLCGVVLTGMGRDGAAGIEAIKAAGGHTIAQDEETSPVFGIPCQAIQTGCVDDVVPASEIADEIVDAFTTDGETDE